LSYFSKNSKKINIIIMRGVCRGYEKKETAQIFDFSDYIRYAAVQPVWLQSKQLSEYCFPNS
jgi:hypothetical protein